jgi:hypothetical protein
MSIFFIHLNRFSENLAKINKSEHEPYTSKEFFHCIRCLANILPDKGPIYAKEKKHSPCNRTSKHGRVSRAALIPYKKFPPALLGNPCRQGSYTSIRWCRPPFSKALLGRKALLLDNIGIYTISDFRQSVSYGMTHIN